MIIMIVYGFFNVLSRFRMISMYSTESGDGLKINFDDNIVYFE